MTARPQYCEQHQPPFDSAGCIVCGLIEAVQRTREADARATAAERQLQQELADANDALFVAATRAEELEAERATLGRQAITDFVTAVERRAEADMLAGNPIEGAHYRALKAEVAALAGDQEPHPFSGRLDRACEVCGLPDRDAVHQAGRPTHGQTEQP